MSDPAQVHSYISMISKDPQIEQWRSAATTALKDHTDVGDTCPSYQLATAVINLSDMLVAMDAMLCAIAQHPAGGLVLRDITARTQGGVRRGS